MPVISSRFPPVTSLTGKIVLVTGASEGIGEALVYGLHQRGARVALVARNEHRLAQHAAPGDLTIPADLTSEAARVRVIEATLAHFGRLDVLINNAGRGSYFPALDTPLPEAHALFELNFFAPFHLAQLAAPHLRAVQGTIVNVSSIAAQISLPWLPLYSASKSALAALTSTQRMQLRPDGIHVMCVFPGYVNTAFQDHAAGSKPPDSVVKGKKYAVSAAECAEAILSGIEHRRHTVITPKAGLIPVLIARLFPTFFESKF